MLIGVWFLTLRNPVVSSFSAVSGGGDVDRRLSLHWNQFRWINQNKSLVVKDSLTKIRKSFPNPLSLSSREIPILLSV